MSDSKSTKKASNKNPSVEGGAQPTTAPGDMPPKRGAPGTPKGWTAKPAPGRGKTKGPRPKRAQITTSVAAANELATSPSYTEDFGNQAPPAGTLSFLITNGKAWRDEWDRATKYAAYAAEQRAAWETAALGQMDTLKQSYEFVKARNPKIAEQYPATAKFLEAANEIAAAAAATRKEKVLAKAKANGAAAPAPTATTATATPTK